MRKAIGDSGEEQRLIRTLARKGFRFIGAVEEIQSSDEVKSPPTPCAINGLPEPPVRGEGRSDLRRRSRHVRHLRPGAMER